MEVCLIILLYAIALSVIIIVANKKDLSNSTRFWCGLFNFCIGIVVGGIIYSSATLTIEDYKQGNYKIRVTTEEVDGIIKSDTIYLKK